MSSTARRVPARTRSAASLKPTEGATSSATTAGVSRLPKAKEVDAPAGAASSKAVAGSTVAGTRKRAALGDLTNASRARSTAATTTRAGSAAANGKDATATRMTKTAATSTGGTKVPRAESSTAGGKRLATRPAEEEPRTTRVVRRAAATTNATGASARSGTTASAIPSRATSTVTDRAGTTGTRRSRPAERQVEESNNGYGEAVRESKRIRVEGTEPADEDDVDVHPAAAEGQQGAIQDDTVPKDAGWEDLDAEDADDPLMVAEYVNEIFGYMKEVEMTTMPNGSYMDTQNEMDWKMRGVLVDWLVDIHTKFRMLPETLFLALNVVDRFLTMRTITLNKLQLVGLTAMFIAAKYEEVLCPSVGNFLYLADGGYNTEEILKAERYMLRVLGFNLSYANPMNFLRRISKADHYDIQTRTVAKYFMEISLVDYRLLEHPPSLVAAASIWMARKVLERGPWTPTLVHYSSYTEYELLGTAEIMLDYVLRPVQHPAFYKKYASKKFMKASAYVVEWARKQYPAGVVSDAEADEQDLSHLRVDLFAEEGLLRPSSDASSRGTASRSVTPSLGGEQA